MAAAEMPRVNRQTAHEKTGRRHCTTQSGCKDAEGREGEYESELADTVSDAGKSVCQRSTMESHAAASSTAWLEHSRNTQGEAGGRRSRSVPGELLC